MRSTITAIHKEQQTLPLGVMPHACRTALLRLVRLVLLVLIAFFAFASVPANAQAPILKSVTYQQVIDIDDHHTSCRCASCNPTKCCCVKVKSSEPAFRPLCAMTDTELRFSASRSVAWSPVMSVYIPVSVSNTACHDLWRAAHRMLTKWSAPPPAQPPQA